MSRAIRHCHYRGFPRVSVVIPCYNYGNYLPGAVASVLNQGGVEVDVLIIDDASPDGSAAVAQRLASSDSRVRLIAHRNNAGHIATYNEGLSKAEGTYLLLLSADDLLTPGSLSRATTLMEEVPSVGLVYGFAPPFVSSPPPARGTARGWTVWRGHEWIATVARRARNPVRTPTAVLRREVHEGSGGYDPRLRHAADFLMWLQAAVHWDIGYVRGADQAFYREHGANMHSTEWAGLLTDIETRVELFDVFFSECFAGSGETDRLRLLANEALATDALRMVRSQGARTRQIAHELHGLLQLAERLSPAKHRNVARLRARMKHSPRAIASWQSTTFEWRSRANWHLWRQLGVYP
jgi:Glycosyl transferase family 2